MPQTFLVSFLKKHSSQLPHSLLGRRDRKPLGNVNTVLQTVTSPASCRQAVTDCGLSRGWGEAPQDFPHPTHPLLMQNGQRDTRKGSEPAVCQSPWGRKQPPCPVQKCLNLSATLTKPVRCLEGRAPGRVAVKFPGRIQIWRGRQFSLPVSPYG